MVDCFMKLDVDFTTASGGLHRLVTPLITEIHSRIWPSPRMTYL